MKKPTLVFIALEEYPNLGIGYMAAVLAKEGFRVRIIDYRKKKSEIFRSIKNLEPEIVGFSILFHSYIGGFAELINYLRNKGIRCHFTAGGHYASLRYKELFSLIPSLDSIVRFEGEYTMLDLAESVRDDKDWRGIAGIAYSEDGLIVANPLRPLEKNLDNFPFPRRSALRKFAFEMPSATMLSGRGCVYDCSFCNTGKFYSQAGGPVKRIRNPEMVVKEMKMLYQKRYCSIFLFLDDDFPVNSRQEPDWVIKFCRGLVNNGMNDTIMWKICCRPDEVDEEKFSFMKKNGLFLVFLGIEDGTERGLRRLNKHISVAQILNSIGILKKLKLGIDFGFLLFQPATTFSSLNENLDFLRLICGDGYMPVTYFKLMPFYETRVEKELLREGRLKSAPGISDYDFSDTSFDQFYHFTDQCFAEWLIEPWGMQNLSCWARNYFLVYSHYFPSNAKYLKQKRQFIKTISESNMFLLDTMKELSAIFESGGYLETKNGLLESYRENIRLKHNIYRNRVQKSIDNLYDLAMRSVLGISNTTKIF